MFLTTESGVCEVLMHFFKNFIGNVMSEFPYSHDVRRIMKFGEHAPNMLSIIFSPRSLWRPYSFTGNSSSEISPLFSEKT